MAWLTLVVAGLFETGFAVALKMSHGMTRIWPTVIFAICALLSFALLTMALRHLEVGAAYAVWTGIGAAGTAVIGMAFLGDTVSTLKLVSISLILAGVVGLNLSDVDLERRTMRVLGKGNKERLVLINKAAKDAIRMYMSLRPRSADGALFLSERGSRLSLNQAGNDCVPPPR